MMLKRVQAACVLLLFALFVVPSFAFPDGVNPRCYSAELFYEDTSYGMVKLLVSGDESRIMVEIEDFIESGEFEVLLFKDYYSSFVVGSLEIDEDIRGEATFTLPYRDPDFQVIVKKGVIELRSGEWAECEKPDKSVRVKVSPSALNLKSMGKWVTVNIRIQSDSEPKDYTMIINGGSLDPYSVKVNGDHVSLKFSREDIQSLCVAGKNMVTISFKIGDETVTLTDIIKVIHERNHEAASPQQEGGKGKMNNSKTKGKNKDK
ncbi:hypothetical protein E4H04_11330 [Candidatus Bathyarchaeota archaeon]|nr:MAG: hypothetical protein E4H04_11330 [Candidatus Bathyarchaeota archaeon]